MDVEVMLLEPELEADAGADANAAAAGPAAAAAAGPDVGSGAGADAEADADANADADAEAVADADDDAWLEHIALSRCLIFMISKLHAMALQQLSGKPELTILTLGPMTDSLEVSNHPLFLHCKCTHVIFAQKLKIGKQLSAFASRLIPPLTQQ